MWSSRTRAWWRGKVRSSEDRSRRSRGIALERGDYRISCGQNGLMIKPTRLAFAELGFVGFEASARTASPQAAGRTVVMPGSPPRGKIHKFYPCGNRLRRVIDNEQPGYRRGGFVEEMREFATASRTGAAARPPGRLHLAVAAGTMEWPERFLC